MSRFLIPLSIALSIATNIGAQESSISTTLSADVVSQYIWRGQECGNISVQPTLGIECNGLSLSAWGNVGFDAADTKELDLTLGYSLGKFNIGISDYWFSDGLDPQSRYFKYKAHCTNHLLEANIGFDFGPLSLQWFTNIAGNDGTCSHGSRAYSSYFEVNVPFSLATVEWTATAGAVPYSTTFYDVSSFAVVNLSLSATKAIHVTDTFEIPIFGQISANPRSEKAYFVVGFTIDITHN